MAKRTRRPKVPRDGHKKKLKSSDSSQLVVSAHPLGIKPLGNLWTSSHSSSKYSRETSLGSFAILTDECLLDLLSYLDGRLAARLSCCSKYLYAFCACNEDLWREWTLRDFPYFVYRDSWKNTYRNQVVKKDMSNAVVRCDQVYSDILYQSWCMMSCFSRYVDWWKRDNIQRYDAKDLDVDTFVQYFEQQSTPLVIRGIVTQWPAYRRWNRRYLMERCGDEPFSVGPTTMTLSQYFHYMETQRDTNPLYLFEKRLSQLPLADDYQVPKYFRDRDLFSWIEKHYHKRPDHAWLIHGPARSGSRFHIDPNQTCAWNAVIRGRKKWVLFPPFPRPPPPGVFPNEDYSQVISPASLMEWFTNFYEEAKNRKDRIECIVEAGELLFIPRGWWHIVLNLEESIAITENYVSETNLSHVLEFLKSKPEQISGWHEKEEDLYRLLVEVIQRERPSLLSTNTFCSTCPPPENISNKKTTSHSSPFRFQFLAPSATD